MREREIKFLVGSGGGLPAPAELVHGLGSVAVDEVDQDAVYFDTSDLRLTRAGASLRYRSDDGWTVKLPQSVSSMIVRDELSFAGDDTDEPPDEATAFVRAIARSAPLLPVAEIRTHRRRLRLRDRRGRPVGEIDDDVVRGAAEGSNGVRFHEVEFEVADDASPKIVAKVVKRLQAAGAKPDGNRSKVSRVLGDSAEAPPDLPPAPALDRRSTVEDLARATLANGTHRLVAADPIVRVGEDPEGVHQARVATRRLRSDLRTLRPVLDRAWSEPLRDELRWIGGLLGRVRDADVLAGLLAEHADTLRPGQHAVGHQLDPPDRGPTSRRPDDAAPGHELHAVFGIARSTGRGRTRAPTSYARGRQQQAKVDEVAARLIRKPWKRLRDQVQRLAADPPDQDLHEVRKVAKQARYALEAVAPATGKQARRAAKRLAALQDTLGDHQDAVVGAQWIERAALRSNDDVDTAFVAGELAESFAADRRRLRQAWPDQWKRARRVPRPALVTHRRSTRRPELVDHQGEAGAQHHRRATAGCAPPPRSRSRPWSGRRGSRPAPPGRPSRTNSPRRRASVSTSRSRSAKRVELAKLVRRRLHQPHALALDHELGQRLGHGLHPPHDPADQHVELLVERVGESRASSRSAATPALVAPAKLASKLLLALEVQVEGRAPDAGLRADLLDGHRIEAALAPQPRRGADQVAAGLLAALLATEGAAGRARCSTPASATRSAYDDAIAGTLAFPAMPAASYAVRICTRASSGRRACGGREYG